MKPGRFLSLEIILVGRDVLIVLARIQVVVIVLDVLVLPVPAVLDVDVLVLEEGGSGGFRVGPPLMLDFLVMTSALVTDARACPTAPP